MRFLVLTLVLLLDCATLFGQSKLCSKLAITQDQTDLELVVSRLVHEQYELYKTHSDRHEMGKILNNCRPHTESKLLVMSFAGTGAYEPRVPALMKELHNCGLDILDEKLASMVYSLAWSSIAKKEKRALKWSGIEAGIFSQLLLTKNLEGTEVNWVTFPSEEAEFLNGDFDYSKLSFSALKKEISDAYDSNPRGIQNARACFEHYKKEASRLNIEPKILIVSHSSGARSAVKFLEKVKHEEVDLIFTIDPVKEAHEALLEVVEQYLALPAKKFANLFLPKKKEIPLGPINVWSRPQPQALYKTSNASRWVNFYQTRDTEGMKMEGIKYGIQGSPIHAAENIFLATGLGSSGHGEITYHPQVLLRFSKELERLFP